MVKTSWINRWHETDLFIFQVLYRAVNYQMEPVRSEGESDETDPSVKVCTSPETFPWRLSCRWACLFCFVPSLCFPVAPYFMKCKSSVVAARLLWFIYASPFSRPSLPPALWYLEWVLMFDDLHHVPSVCGWMLIWSCLLPFRCPIDVSTPLLFIFKPIYLSLVCVPTHTHHVCVLRAFSFLDPQQPCHPLPDEVLMKGINALAPARWPSTFGFDVVFSWAVTKTP